MIALLIVLSVTIIPPLVVGTWWLIKTICLDSIQIYTAAHFAQLDIDTRRAHLETWEEYAVMAIRQNRVELLQREVGK